MPVGVCDVSCRHTFQKLEEWLHEVRELAPGECVVTLVGNKADFERACALGLNLMRPRPYANLVRKPYAGPDGKPYAEPHAEPCADPGPFYEI